MKKRFLFAALFASIAFPAWGQQARVVSACGSLAPFGAQTAGSLAYPTIDVNGYLCLSGGGGGGGITDAPSDGTSYARKNAAWAHLTHNDLTDWTATLAPYATTAAVSSAYMPLAGGAFTGGINFGSVTASVVSDLSKHISLFGAAYGIGVTNGFINVKGTAVNMVSGSAVTGTFGTTGLTMGAATDIILVRDPSSALQAATKQYVDAKTSGGVSCASGTVTAATMVVTNGIVTHC